jgi:hypothetical protein
MHLSRHQTQFIILLVLTVFIQLILLYTYHPVLFNDTNGFKGLTYVPLSYRELAINLLHGDLSNDLGARSPGYPAFMAMCFYVFGQDNYQSIVILQSLFNIVLFFSAYWLWSQIFGSNVAAIAATATAVLEPAIILCGSNILSETLSVTLLISSLALIIYSARFLRFYLVTSLLSGLFVAWLALTRPSFQILIPLYGVYMTIVLGNKVRTGTGMLTVFTFLICSSAPVLGWNTYNYQRFEYFTMMTTQGYILTSHSGQIINGQPDKYEGYEDVATIVDKYSRETGWGIWEAYPEIMKLRNTSFVESSKLSEKMSLLIFKENPYDYIKSILKAVKRFWQSKLFTGNDLLNNNIFSIINAIYSQLHKLGIFLFFGVLLVDIFKPGTWFKPTVIERVLIYSIVLIICLGSTIPIAVENARYKIPLLPLIWGIVAGSLVTNAHRVRELFTNWR